MHQFRSEGNICFGIGVYNKDRFACVKKSSCITFKFLEGNCLYQDGLHLLDTGKKILERNFIFVLNKFFLDMNAHHPPITL